MTRRPLLAALALVLAVSVTACTSDDDDPEPTAMPTTPSASSSPTPSIGADQDAIDSNVRSAIESGDTAALRDALRAAGEADGKAAAADSSLARDADVRRNYRIAGWWLPEYEDDADFSRLFDDGDLLPYDTLAAESSLLTDLATLADNVQDDWEDETGKKLSFNDTYDAAFDAARTK